MKYLAVAIAALGATHALDAQGTDIAAWRQDLRIIAEEVPARHPDAFYRMSKPGWDSAVISLDARLPQMTRNQAMVAFMQLVAMINDGHTSINPLFDPALDVHYYPLELHLFDDGLYVKSAAPAYASIVGTRVIRIGSTTAEDAIRRVGTTVSHENEWFARAWAPGRLSFAEILDGLGIANVSQPLALVIERNGRQETASIGVAGKYVPGGHNPLAGIPKAGWTDMGPGSSSPLWMKNPGMPYWSEYVSADSTLYVSYRGVINMPRPTNQQFWQSVFATADSLPVNRLVLDLRENPGGNSFYNRQVVRGIVARPNLDQRGKLFVVTSGKTFSAAMNLVLDLEAWTNATTVGEPTGNATVFYGDHAQVRLPVSGITVNVSTLPWYPDDPRDTRSFIAPRVYTPMTAAQYRAGIDPAMTAILSRGTGPALGAQLERLVLASDTLAAARLIAAESAKPENRFATPEAEVNTLGYRLNSHQQDAALTVFRLNTRAFPRSANTWDSLGEALVAAGQRDAGIAAYRKALEVSPGLPSAVSALARLH